jgi:hypothetical protein
MMAALVVAALFWGNCFSCPQVLLALKTHQPAHGCCHRTKQTSSGCTAQSLQHFVKADPGTQVPAVPVVARAAEPAPAIARLADLSPAPAEQAPPGDLFSLRI